MKLTAEQLKKLGACREQIELFIFLTGGEVEVTEEWCLSVYNRFNWAWGALRILRGPIQVEYSRICGSALEKHSQICTPAKAEYDRVCAQALKEHMRRHTLSWDEYDRVRYQAWKEYNLVRDPSWDECCRVFAKTFGRLYGEQSCVE